MIKRLAIIIPFLLLSFFPVAGQEEEEQEEEAPQANAAPATAEKEYIAPVRPIYAPRSTMSYSIDVAVLFLGLLLASFIFLRKKAVVYAKLLLFFSMLYFGFFRHGCVCAPGATGNISLALFHVDKYVIDIFTVLIFFIPLLFALFCGRVFCGMLCPLGAVQECISVKKTKLPRMIDRLLSWLPFIVLGLVCWRAFSDKDLIMCRLDPFVSIFRLKVHFSELLYSGAFLAVCIFIYRPFCKYLCPYGVLLGLFSRMSFYKKSFSSFCEKCGNCAEKCPSDCISENKIAFSKCIACNRCINPACRSTRTDASGKKPQ